MYLQALKSFMSVNNLRAADIAKLAKISRAAVSKWFHQPSDWVNVESSTLMRLALSLNITPDLFLKKTPDLSPWQTRFLWDRLYTSMEKFVRALRGGEPPALARLVQVTGFFCARHILGKKIVRDFPKYKQFIKPIRRRHLEILWPLYSSG